jgi:hypothetical protein
MSQNFPPVSPAPASGPVPTAPSGGKGLAIASLVLGIINLCSWIIPLCGGPLSIIGIVLGVLGLKSAGRNMAIAGLVLSGLALLLVIINALAGVFLGPQIGNIFSTINQSLGGSY